MKRSRFFIYLLFYFLPGQVPLLAQVNDAGLWIGIDLEKKLGNGITLQFSDEIRMNENISEVGTWLNQIGLEYRINKVISTSVAYRLIQKHLVDDSYSTRHRYLINLNIREKLGRVSLIFRTRYQSQYSDVLSSENGKLPDNYLRTRVMVKYDSNRKYTPFLSGETFFHLNHSGGVLLDNYRISGGISYEWNKKSSLNLGYMVDREINISDPWTNYVITLSWEQRL